MVLALKRTKTEAAGLAKVVLTNPGVVQFLTRYRVFMAAKPSTAFVDVSYGALRRWLRRTSVALGFSADCFRSHSCRRGGATALSIKGWPIVDIMMMGRWQSDSSCRLYIKGGEVAMLNLMTGIDDEQLERISMLAKSLPRVPFSGF